MKTTDREQMPFNVGVLSVVKHDYLPRAIAAHPRFNLSFVTDEISRPQWTHERNQIIYSTLIQCPKIQCQILNLFSLIKIV